MAIKVNGTTVIDDSRNLVNIASGAGSSTDFNAVGTYAALFHNTGPDYAPGSAVAVNGSTSFRFMSINLSHSGYSVYPSGTWRTMGPWHSGQTCICVRIS
jgi:hypothetical protein